MDLSMRKSIQELIGPVSDYSLWALKWPKIKMM
jgi:hypothetical protein